LETLQNPFPAAIDKCPRELTIILIIFDLLPSSFHSKNKLNFFGHLSGPSNKQTSNLFSKQWISNYKQEQHC